MAERDYTHGWCEGNKLVAKNDSGTWRRFGMVHVEYAIVNQKGTSRSWCKLTANLWSGIPHTVLVLSSTRFLSTFMSTIWIILACQVCRHNFRYGDKPYSKYASAFYRKFCLEIALIDLAWVTCSSFGHHTWRTKMAPAVMMRMLAKWWI